MTTTVETTTARNPFRPGSNMPCWRLATYHINSQKVILRGRGFAERRRKLVSSWESSGTIYGRARMRCQPEPRAERNLPPAGQNMWLTERTAAAEAAVAAAGRIPGREIERTRGTAPATPPPRPSVRPSDRPTTGWSDDICRVSLPGRDDSPGTKKPELGLGTDELGPRHLWNH